MEAMPADKRRQYLATMGIQLWERRELPGREQDVQLTEPPATAPAPAPAVKVTSTISALDWKELENRVASCTQCGLHAKRNRTVFGTGDKSARWMVIGEAPGADEDRAGEPFVGRAGKLLNAMIRAAGCKREEVFIANIVKCRPPGNRDPAEEEIAHCSAYLERQIDLLQPMLILAAGRVAAQSLLHSDLPVGRLRGRIHHYGEAGIPLVVTYHPAYLLRSPEQKRKAWSDLQLALGVCAPGSG